MGLRFADAIPSTTLNKAMVPIEEKALATVRASVQPVLRSRRIRRPDMCFDFYSVSVASCERHLRRETLPAALVVVEGIKWIELDRNTGPTSVFIEDVECDGYLA